MAATGTAANGPPPSAVHTMTAEYMPSMTKSPCAKFTTFIMPQIRVRPDEKGGTTAPSSRTDTITCTSVIDTLASLSRGRFASPALVGQDHLVGGALLRP